MTQPTYPELGTDLHLDLSGSFRLTAGGDLALCMDETCMIQGIRHRFSTPLGGLFYDLLFGLDFKEYLHLDNTDLTRAALIETVRHQLYLEPRIMRRSIEITVVDWAEKSITLGVICAWIESEEIIEFQYALDLASGEGTVIWMPEYLRAEDYVQNETPSGVVDGVNKVFTLAYTPQTNTLRVFLDGQWMEPGVDYTLSWRVVTFATAPASVAGYTPKVRASYYKK